MYIDNSIEKQKNGILCRFSSTIIMKGHLLPYVIVATLTFFCAEGLICLFEYLTKKTAPYWVFTPLWILSFFLLATLFVLLCLFWVACCGVRVWLGELIERIRKKRNNIETTGVIGKVYTTQTGRDEANPERDEFGWEQTDATMRIRVRAERDELAVHSIGWVWKPLH